MNTILGQERARSALKCAVEGDIPTLLVGETGTGKTGMIQELAAAEGKTLIRVNLNGQTTVDDFIGKWLIVDGNTKWFDGALLNAARSGYWLLCDEINAALPEILFALHPLLDDDRKIMVVEHDGEIVKPSTDFRFFATMNPSDEYAGTKELNKAFLSRFGMILEVEYPTIVVEKKILVERCDLEETLAAKMADFAAIVRKSKSDGQIWTTISTRDLIQWGIATKKFDSINDAFEFVVLGKVGRSDRESVVQVWRTVCGTYDVLAKKVGNPQIFEELESREADIKKRSEELRKKEKEIEKKLVQKVRKNARLLIQPEAA